MSIRYLRPFHAALHYHVLAHLDLGQDAASLFDARLPRRDWVEDLQQAYQKAGDRLVFQVLPLFCESLDCEYQMLSEPLFGRRESSESGHPRETLQRALEDEREHFSVEWGKQKSREARTIRRFGGSHGALLGRLRNALFAPNGAPQLDVLFVGGLANGRWTRGRATVWEGRQIIAVSPLVSKDALLIQLLHEEIHSVTDPAIRDQSDLPQNTTVGASGFALHLALERAAIERGHQLIDSTAPRLRRAYRKWCAEHGFALS